MNTNKSLLNTYNTLKTLTKQKYRTLDKLAQIDNDINKIIKKISSITKAQKKKKA